MTFRRRHIRTFSLRHAPKELVDVEALGWPSVNMAGASS
jgi:hypothetical protein